MLVRLRLHGKKMSEERVKGRKARIALLEKMIKEAGGESINKTLARFCIKTCITEYTARKYLKLLIDAEAIEKVETIT